MRYDPSARVVVCAIGRPFRKKTIFAPAAGSSHGCAVEQTGVIGPRVTVPRTTPAGVRPAEAAETKASANTTARDLTALAGYCEWEDAKGRPEAALRSADG